MHGLINGSFQCFVVDTFGQDRWRQIVTAADVGFETFEPVLTYEDDLTHAVLRAAREVLSTTHDLLLEDFGTYLVAHPRMGVLRGLLRLGGETYEEFLFSLDDLPDRARLAVEDLEFPILELRVHGFHGYSLSLTSGFVGIGHVFVGALRALADDYGTLAYLEHRGRSNQTETLSIELLELDFAEGREFDLSEVA